MDICCSQMGAWIVPVHHDKAYIYKRRQNNSSSVWNEYHLSAHRPITSWMKRTNKSMNALIILCKRPVTQRFFVFHNEPYDVVTSFNSMILFPLDAVLYENGLCRIIISEKQLIIQDWCVICTVVDCVHRGHTHRNMCVRQCISVFIWIYVDTHP